MNLIFDYNRTIFDPETNDLYPGVFEMLKNLSQKHALFLVSRNEPMRSSQIAIFGITPYFQKVFFVKEETPELFAEISGNASGKTIVIGDSIRDEVMIGNMLGLITVRIIQGKFASETATHPIQTATHEVKDIKEIEPIINHYEG